MVLSAIPFTDLHLFSPIRRDCVATEWKQVKTEQPAGFQGFRMRTFRLEVTVVVTESQLFHKLEAPILIVERLRPKAFSPVCLYRFLEYLPLFPITTQPLKGRGVIAFLA